METTVLEYVGDGTSFTNVPARNLTAKDVKKYNINTAELIASGLYEEVKKPLKKKKSQTYKTEVKE